MFGHFSSLCVQEFTKTPTLLCNLVIKVKGFIKAFGIPQSVRKKKCMLLYGTNNTGLDRLRARFFGPAYFALKKVKTLDINIAKTMKNLQRNP